MTKFKFVFFLLLSLVLGYFLLIFTSDLADRADKGKRPASLSAGKKS